MVNIVVKQENPHDAVCTQLIHDLSAELGERYGDDGTAFFSLDDVTVTRSCFVVAWSGNTPVGCGAVRPLADDIVEIKRVFVKSDFRGQGISRIIMAKLETLAREFAYKHIRLETGTKQPEAIKLYESSGYTRIDRFPPYDTDPLSVCYEKHLTS